MLLINKNKLDIKYGECKGINHNLKIQDVIDILYNLTSYDSVSVIKHMGLAHENIKDKILVCLWYNLLY